MFTETGLVTANGDKITGVTETSTGAPVSAPVGTDPIVPSAATGSGLGNYTITYVNGRLTVNPAPLTITANNDSKTYGTLKTFSGTAFTETGLVAANGDTITGVTETSTGAPASAPMGTYPIVPSAATGSGLSNYTIGYVNGTLTVNSGGSTTTQLTSSAKTSSFGLAVTLTATVTASAGSGSPTGTVTFYDGPVNSSDQIGIVTLRNCFKNGSRPRKSLENRHFAWFLKHSLSTSSGVTTAALRTSSLPVGNDTITATYSGDGNFLTSTGTLTITINQSIIVLDPSVSGALSLAGRASINVSGVVYVDSSSSSALSATGNAQVKASVIDVHGGVQKRGNASLSPTPITGAAVLADPLAALPLPSTSGLTNYGTESLSGNSSATIQPGIYKLITVSGNAKLTLSSGVYIIEGGGFSVSGNASVSGSGVMIFNAGSNYPSTGGTYGSIALSRNGSYNLSPLSTGTYAGIVIFQPHDNTNTLSVSGNASGMTGAIYAPAAQLTESGNGQLNTAIVVDKMTTSGNRIAHRVLGQGTNPAVRPLLSPQSTQSGRLVNNPQAVDVLLERGAIIRSLFADSTLPIHKKLYGSSIA